MLWLLFTATGSRDGRSRGDWKKSIAQAYCDEDLGLWGVTLCRWVERFPTFRRNMVPSEIWRVIQCKKNGLRLLEPWWWRRHVRSKRREPRVQRHRWISQKTWMVRRATLREVQMNLTYTAVTVGFLCSAAERGKMCSWFYSTIWLPERVTFRTVQCACATRCSSLRSNKIYCGIRTSRQNLKCKLDWNMSHYFCSALWFQFKLNNSA